MMFCVCVTFKIFSEHKDAFQEAINHNASVSKSLEPDCHQFDVCINDEFPNEVFLYEVYSSPDAFKVHLNSEHFKKFDANVSAMIEEKVVKTYFIVNQ